MIIAVEGPDCCGKTTFGNELSKILDIPILKLKQFAICKKRSETKCWAQVSSMENFSHKLNFILDRFLLTNLVYNQIYYNIKSCKRYFNLIEKMDVIIIMISVSFKELREKIKERKDNKDVMKDIKQIHLIYNMWYQKIKEKYKYQDRIILLNGFQPMKDMLWELVNKKECSFWIKSKISPWLEKYL